MPGIVRRRGRRTAEACVIEAAAEAAIADVARRDVAIGSALVVAQAIGWWYAAALRDGRVDIEIEATGDDAHFFACPRRQRRRRWRPR